MNSGIYQIRNLNNEKLYIGSAKNFTIRQSRHFQKLKENKHHSQRLQNSYNKHGKDAFVFEVLELLPLKHLIAKEQIYIDTIKPWYNMSPTAGSPLGVKHTKKSRLNMRNGQLNSTYVQTPEHKAKLIAALKSRPPISEETRKKLSQSNTGKKHSAETIAKMVAAKKANKKPPTDEYRESQRQKQLGKKDSPETKEKKRIAAIKRNQDHPDIGTKISLKLTGRKLSEEHRAKCANGRKGKPLTKEHKQKLSAFWAEKRKEKEYERR